MQDVDQAEAKGERRPINPAVGPMFRSLLHTCLLGYTRFGAVTTLILIGV